MAEPFHIPVTEEQPSEAINIAPAAPPVDPEMIRQRARHYHQGLGAESPGEDRIFNRLINGDEDNLRRELTVKEQSRLFNQRSEFLRKYIQNRPADAGPPSRQEVSIINRLSSGELAQAQAGDPRTYIERRIAQNTTAQVAPVRPETPAAYSVDEYIERQHVLTEHVQKRLEELANEAREQGWGSYLWDFAGQIASPLQWYRQQNLIQQNVTSSWLLGQNTFQQVQWYFSQNPSVGIEALDKAIDQLKGQNLLTAIQYLSMFNDASSFNIAMQDLSSALDVAPFVGWVPYAAGGRLITAAGRRIVDRASRPSAEAARAAHTAAATQIREYATAVQQAAEAAVINRGRVDAPAAVAEASGDLARAGEFTARQQLLDLAAQTHGPEALQSFQGYARSFFSPTRVISEAGPSLSNESAQRIATTLESNAERMTRALVTEPVNIPRLRPGSSAEQEAALEAYRVAVNHQYSNLADRVLDARVVFPTHFAQMPPALRKTAETATNLEREITKHGLTDRYLQFQDAFTRDKEIAYLLSRSLGRKTPPKAPTDRLRAAMSKAEGITPDEAKALIDEWLYVRQELNSFSKPDATLFRRAMIADRKFIDARVKHNLSPRVVRPNGLDPVTHMSDIPVIRGLGNVPHIIIPIGNKNAELFKTREAATLSAVRELGLKPGSYHIVKQGTGWHIGFAKPLDETLPSVRQQLTLDTQLSTPRPWLPHWFIQAMPWKGGATKVSAETAADLKAMTYSSSGMYQEVTRVVRETITGTGISRLGKQSEKDWVAFIEYQRSLTDPDTKIPGVFSKNQLEFEQQWMAKHGRQPTEAESLAYWSYVQINNIDKLMADLSIYRDKARAGLQHHDLPLMNKPGDAPLLEGRIIDTTDQSFFDMARNPHSRLTTANRQGAGFLVWDRDPNAMSHIYINAKDGQKKIEALQSKGYKVLQITHFAENDLAAIPSVDASLKRIAAEKYKYDGRPRIEFILTRELNSQPLPFQQTPNRAGGHHQYAFTHLIRQANIRNDLYYGDHTLRGFQNKSDAAFFLPRYEHARKLMNDIDASDGRIPEQQLIDYLGKNLPEDVSEFRRLFTTGPYDRNTPFKMTKDGESVWKTYKLQENNPSLANIADSRLNMYNTSTLKNMLERGQTPLTIARRGTTENPTFHLKPAPMVDALATMDRAINHLIRNRQISDVQIKGAEQFIAEFSPILAKPIEELRRDPLDALLNPVFREGADPFHVAAARNYSTVMKENLGIAQPEMIQWSAVRQKIADGVQSIAGGKPEEWLQKHPSLQKSISHPMQATRNATSYYFLTTPYQFMIQAAGSLNIAAHAGWRIAGESLPAAIYGRIVRDYTGVKGETTFKTAKGSSYTVTDRGTTIRTKGHADKGLKPESESTIYINDPDFAAFRAGQDVPQFAEPAVGRMPIEYWTKPDGKRIVHYGNKITSFSTKGSMLDYAAEKLTAFGWRRQDFREAYEAGRSVGFFEVGREHALIDDIQGIQSARRGIAGTALHWGMAPFRKGEETMRHMAWWAAYKMWKEANPTAVLDDMSKISILNQADRMAGNMSTVGMSSAQRSGLGIPTTFWGYNLRLWEQLWGLDQHKLTAWQRSKLFGNMFFVNSMLFGVPATVGLATFLPAYEAYRRWMLSEEISSMSEPSEASGIGSGMVAFKNHEVFGHIYNLMTKGAVSYVAPGTNITERLSPGGNRFFAEAMGDKNTFELMLGATGSALRDSAVSLQPFIVFLMDSWRPANEQLGATIGMHDFERVIANIGGRGASAAMKAYWALSLQELMSNQRITQTGLTQYESIMLSLTGLQPERVGVRHDILANETSLRDTQRYLERHIVQEYREMLRASLDDRHDDAVRHSRNMRVMLSLGHFRPDQIASVVGRAGRDTGEAVENVFRRFALGGPEQARFYQQYLRPIERQ